MTSTFSIQDAVDMLDALSADVAPSRADIVHGAVALALNGPSLGDDLQPMLIALEHLILDRQSELDAPALERAGRIASKLRHLVGVH